jgi:hypothetical protein
MSVIVNLLSKFDDSGVKKAKHGFEGLEKTLKHIGIGLGIKEVADFLLDSAKGAALDEKSTKLLNTQLSNNLKLTKSQILSSNKFVEKLSLQTGIVKNQLRPAYARFANVTHNVKDAQKLLTLSLNAAAGSGKSQTRIAKALEQAYGGNTKSLQRLFPELKNSKDALGALSKEYKGMAEINADPFMKFNNSIEIMKEKLGNAILPIIVKFMDFLSQPGGLIDTVGKFFEEASNPKTDVGKAFTSLGQSATLLGDDLATLFGMMDPNNEGNSLNGFASGLQLLADLIANIADGATVLAGILKDTFTGNFMEALKLSGADIGVGAYALRKNIGVDQAIQQINANTLKKGQGTFIGGMGYFDMESSQNVDSNNVSFPTSKTPNNLFSKKSTVVSPQNILNITVTSADPKAVVDAVSQWVKQNGKVPTSWGVTSSNGTGMRH